MTSTPQRRTRQGATIAATLADLDEFKTAQDIHDLLRSHGEKIGLATVYRVLTQFEASGLIKRYHFEGGQSVFEINQGAHHDHMLCLDCGRIEEFCDEEIERRQRIIAQRLGFELTEHSLILYGHCNRPDCSSRAGDGEDFDPQVTRGEN